MEPQHPEQLSTTTADTTLATKGYVLTKFGAAGNGTVTEITAGVGLTTNVGTGGGDPIDEVGTLSVVAANNTILVDATGIKVNPAALPDAPVSTVNDISPDAGTTNITLTAANVAALPIVGGTMTGDITFNAGQTFPGTIDSINTSIVPDANGDITLTAANVDAVSKTAGGTFDAALTVAGSVSVTGTGNKFVGDGSGLTNLNVPSSLRFKGTTNVALSAPSAVAGDFYLNTVAGTAAGTWTGIDGDSVLNNQFVLYTVGNQWVEGATLDGSAFVTMATDQTISGNKTFSNDVTIPQTPTAATDAASKGYVDTTVGAIPAAPVTSVNTKTGVVVLTPGDVGALATVGGTMTGDITFNTDQTFPGTVIQVNGQSPDGSGVLALTAAEVDAVSAAEGGAFLKEVTGPDVAAGTSVSALVNKKYVDAQVATSSGDVESVTAGNGLAGGTVDATTPTGTFTVLAADNTIT